VLSSFVGAPERHQIVALLFHRAALTPLGRRRSKSLDAIRESPSKVASAVPSAAAEENPTSADLPSWSSGPKVDYENIKLRFT
jgi:hypothetical protein